MNILVLGSGLMGPAAAYNAMSDPDVSRVTMADMSGEQLEAAHAQLAHKTGRSKLTLLLLDLNDWRATVDLMANHDVIIAALPSAIIATGLRAAFSAHKPWVDLSWPPPNQVEKLRHEAEAAGVLIIPGCGVEPGLTEILARRLIEGLDQVDELHIKCGGIPAQPEPPLGYKIVFGGRRLPLRPHDAFMVQDGQLIPVPRYSGVESVHFAGVGEVEAWHEGFVPWLLDLEALHHLKVGTQKTIRWPGFAAKVSVLNEMGLLSDTPIEVEGVPVSPRKLLDTLLYPYVRMGVGDRDLTLLRIDALGLKEGQRVTKSVEMVDRYDETLGFTSMARVTGFTASIVARMVVRGEVQGAGLIPPEQLVIGAAYDRLVTELAAANVHFQKL